jgi:hypothetical protein
MADDKTKSAPKDAKPVSLEDREVAYWTLKFGVARQRLAEGQPRRLAPQRRESASI